MGGRDIVKRILKDGGGAEEALSLLSRGLPPSDLQSLLMYAFRDRAARLAPSDVLKQYGENRFVKPAAVSSAKLCEIDSAAYSLLPPDFAAVEPSPLSPFGSASALGPVSQDKIVTTARMTEVCPDVTNYLALECAVRRAELLKADRHSLACVKLCASQRQVRAQSFSGPNSFAHFRIFALCTAGHDEGNYQFEREAALEHVSFYVTLLRALAGRGYGVRGIEVETVLYDEACAGLASGVQKGLREALGLPVGAMEKLDQNYYRCMGIHVTAINESGEKIFLADGGFTDWTQKLLGNRKERLLTSGMGTERLAYCF
jgi:hypothetical protein